MFIGKCNGGYDRHGLQRSGPGDFLILMQGEGTPSGQMKAVVRRVSLGQFGHFMMGSARIGGFNFTMSGAYGGDGLPITVPMQLYENYGLVVPQELYDQWNKGGGWNSCGSEACSMREWANQNLKALKKNPNYKAEPEGFPNIDGMTTDELSELFRDYWKSRLTHTLRWTGQFAEDYSFGSIVSLTADARRSREKGHVSYALHLEQMVNEYYQEIPEQFRW